MQNQAQQVNLHQLLNQQIHWNWSLNQHSNQTIQVQQQQVQHRKQNLNHQHYHLHIHQVKAMTEILEYIYAGMEVTHCHISRMINT